MILCLCQLQFCENQLLLSMCGYIQALNYSPWIGSASYGNFIAHYCLYTFLIFILPLCALLCDMLAAFVWSFQSRPP